MSVEFPKSMLAALCGVFGCLSATGAMAVPVTVTATNLASETRFSGGPGFLYSISPSQGEYDPLMTFITAPYAGRVASAGTLTLTVVDPYTRGTILNTSLSAYALTADYDPNSPSFASTSPNANPANATLLSVFTGGFSRGSAATFTIPMATIAAWADTPSTNHGLIFVQSNTWDDGIGRLHSDLGFYSAGTFAPSLTFAVLESSDVPEPASMAILAAGVLGLGLVRLKRQV